MRKKKRYHVVFAGKLVPGIDAATVKSNLILDFGLSAEKAETLFTKRRVVLKRFDNAGEAQRLAERFELSGGICAVEEHIVSAGSSASGESSLITFFNRFKPASKKSSKKGRSTKRKLA